MKKTFNIEYKDTISMENLLLAWQEFQNGKKKREDVLEFQKNLMSNLIFLHTDLKTKIYTHSEYKAFNISDPKPRNIHKASVRDRVLHHAIHRILYPYFNNTFISDSYSCRLGKGTLKSADRFRKFAYKVSKNNTKTCWVLKCDIRKFFASVDHKVLKNILSDYIYDTDILCLLGQVVDSFNTKNKIEVGLPLGNLTSQLMVNIYMNKFDQWMKHRMKIKYYIRYTDDFVIFSQDKDYLWELVPKIADFLEEELKLTLHPNKIFIKTIASGMDFLGWVNFSDHRILRTTTKRKMFRKIKESGSKIEMVQSYLGLLSHGNSNKLNNEVMKYSH
ncbi:MAG: RNA-directed DNA polymerase [Parcubacteria group bacterium GW2011_GWB1_35_5]|uniref:Reverse transcriptase domain-containing protein n=1 Tax=Candidatus Zambryskibacteria bacterium CG10_big_fil_rev_8_21_14_0_10_34_34 TaxID=1975114 RepID=A0A2H0R1G6_9BACT|nr:MAG: RNA-directed DNA polymerase [Parcubacteria group bacterium GW2011_GWB1_35_5]PIR40371.1 MAG: hypothetical protein COV33_00025 [Candidatus Zambryskibacteria bacterium CG10_big_fil_rev_8_21_14_0_10_34_34]